MLSNMLFALYNKLLALDNTFVALDNVLYLSDNSFLRWINPKQKRVIQREYIFSNANTCYSPQVCVIQNEKRAILCKKCSIQCDNVLSNARTCDPMQERFIQLFNTVKYFLGFDLNEKKYIFV